MAQVAPRDQNPCQPRPAGARRHTPATHGVTKLSGSSDRWRVRVGDYRIIYRIDDTTREVTVLRIAHRRQAYR